MAPDIAKVDADRDLNLGLPAWNFSDEVLRWLLHGNSLLLLRRTCSSHLSGLILPAGLKQSIWGLGEADFQSAVLPDSHSWRAGA